MNRASEPTLGWRTRWSIRLARLVRWEFWPGPVFYLPVVAYIVWRAVVTGQWTRFTAVNPGISHGGGLIGESKHETLVPLAQGMPAFVAEFEQISADLPPAERTRRALAFAARQPRPWPVVLKPDRGERGRGVRIAYSEAAVVDYFHRLHVPVIVQAYVPGAEFGLFFVRRPGAAGELVSLTEKQLLQLVGDGRHRVRELILQHPRAKLIASMLFQRFVTQLDHVLTDGATLPIADVGSHCRGALFLDGQALCTPALVARVRQLAAAMPGFEFGRLDVRAASREALAAGEDFQVIEVNGASSEPAHVYHPGTPLRVGLRAFLGIWRDMMEIGAANARQGVPWIRPLALLAMAWREHRALRGIDWPSNVWEGDRSG